MNNQKLAEKTKAVFVSQCYKRGYAAPVDILKDLGYLQEKQYQSWRHGQVDYLERVCTANLHKLSFVMKQIRSCAAEYHCRPSVTIYRHKSHNLRFSKSGDPSIERAYMTHYVNMDMKKKTEARESSEQ